MLHAYEAPRSGAVSRQLVCYSIPVNNLIAKCIVLLSDKINQDDQRNTTQLMSV